MSANLDLVRSIYADWERGDFSRVDWADAQIEFVFADGPEPGGQTGLIGIADAWRSYLSAWHDYHTVVDEFHELDGGRVLVLFRAGGRGRTSGVQVEEARANLFHIDGGLVTKIVSYWDRDGAFADLALEG